MSNALKPKETHELFASLGGDASAPPVVNIAPTHEMPIGSTGAIVTLPTLGDLSGQAKKILEPLRLYPCVTESPLTKGRNYQTHIIPLDKKLRIPLENIVFSSVELTEEKIKKAELLIHKHQLAYQAEVDALLASYTSVVSIPTEDAIYYPRVDRDLPAMARPYFTVGRAHRIRLYDTIMNSKQSFTLEGVEIDGNFHVPVTSVTSGLSNPPVHNIIYGVPSSVIIKLEAMAVKVDLDIYASLSAFFASDVAEPEILSAPAVVTLSVPPIPVLPLVHIESPDAPDIDEVLPVEDPVEPEGGEESQDANQDTLLVTPIQLSVPDAPVAPMSSVESQLAAALALLAAKDETIKALTETVKAKDEVIAGQKDLNSAKDEIISGLKEKLADREATIADLKENPPQADPALKEKNVELQEHNVELQEHIDFLIVQARRRLEKNNQRDSHASTPPILTQGALPVGQQV